MALRRTLGLLSAAALALAACAPATPATPTPAPPTPAPATPTPAPATPTPLALQCGPDSPHLKTAGQLTLSTDNPSYPPWWGGDPETQYPGQPADAPEWEISNPYSGQGFESAVAYAVAEELGFSREQIVWLQNAVFEQAFAPGPKAFDWHMAQVSIRPERAEAVDFSDPYFDAHQSLLALSANPIVNATTITELRSYRLGAAQATTSFQLIEDVIQPTVEPRVFPDNAAALLALESGTIDGLIVDLGTAFFMRDAQLEDWDTPEPEGRIVGAFSTDLQRDQLGMVLELDSPYTDCVNQALAALRADGRLDAIYDEWIVTGQEVPFFEP